MGRVKGRRQRSLGQVVEDRLTVKLKRGGARPPDGTSLSDNCRSIRWERVDRGDLCYDQVMPKTLRELFVLVTLCGVVLGVVVYNAKGGRYGIGLLNVMILVCIWMIVRDFWRLNK